MLRSISFTDEEIRERIEKAKADKKNNFLKGNMNFRKRQAHLEDSIQIIQKSLIAQSILEINLQGAIEMGDVDTRIENLINAMRNKPLERSQKDIGILTKFLNSSLLAQKFKEDGIGESPLAKFLFFLV